MKILLLVTLLLSVLCLSSCQLLKEAPPAAEALRMMAGLFPPKSSNLTESIILEDDPTHNQLKGFVHFSQCDARWGDHRLGTGPNTICQAGCAMTSLSMVLNTHGVNVDPGSLNSWLTSHGGYASGDLLVWSASNAFHGPQELNYYHGSGSLSVNNLADMTKAGKGIIVNVRSGTHWVLVTGHAGGNTFTVNDPGFPTTSYDYTTMSNFVVYSA